MAGSGDSKNYGVEKKKKNYGVEALKFWCGQSIRQEKSSGW